MKHFPKPPSSTKTKNPTSEPRDLFQQIRERAFALYLERGREAGHELEDWLQAESEIIEARTKSVAA